MKERNKHIARRWLSTLLIVTMLFTCMGNSIALPYVAWAGESATASNARNKRVTLAKAADEDVQITILSDEQSYESGDDICLELIITNNSDGEIKDGLLKYSKGKSSGIEQDTAYFEDVNDVYMQALLATQEKKVETSKAEESLIEEDKTEEIRTENGRAEENSEVSELETEESARESSEEAEVMTQAREEDRNEEPEKAKIEEKNEADVEESEITAEESGATAEENKEKNNSNDDDYPQYLSELNIAPGESYHVNFYYTVAEDIEKIAGKGIEFTFKGTKETEIKDEYGEVQETETKKFSVSKKFLYTINGMNLIPVAFTGDEDGKIIRGEKAEMILDFSLGNLEVALDEWAMENDNGEIASPSDSKEEQTASKSNAPKITSALIKWEGDKIASTNKEEERPFVQNLHCDVEIPGVMINDFVVTNNASEDDDYNTSAICSFTIDRKTKPGTYYGEVKATYDVKDGRRKASGKSTQGVVLVVSQTNDEQVLEIIQLIDELPESNEVMEKMMTLEDDGNDEAWEAYYMELSDQVQVTYTQYSSLADEQKEMVDNSEKLMEYVEIFGVTTLAVTNEITINYINQYGAVANNGTPTTMLVYNMNNAPSGNNYKYWNVIVVEQNVNGKYYVTQYVKSGSTDMGGGISKVQIPQKIKNGFVLYCYGIVADTKVGDEVTCFNYGSISSGGYNQNGYGKIIFSEHSNNGNPKPDKKNNLTPIESADTSKLITVNLYDYDTNINEKYNGNHKYPGFQNPYGTRDSSNVGAHNNNFGDNITGQGKSLITTAENPGLINVTNGGANKPLENGAMSKTLGNDGYPALNDGSSLKYLFNEEDGYAQKQNKKSINGLFQYNASNGQYYFNSRENHAEFDASDDTFKLYNQLITSNYTMYPFGNFLPLNHIKTECQQVSEINRAYTKQIADSAQYKYSQGKNTEYDKYDVLASTMNAWISAMDAKYQTNWTAREGIDAYFSQSGIPQNLITEELLEKLYCIDYDEKTNFFFGMEMEMNFIQPKDGKIKTDVVENDADDVMNGLMKFYFTGDDDVWVYVDGVLFLDLSGIHRHVGGDIDFTNGEVHYYELMPKENGDIGETAYKMQTFEEILKSAGKSTDALKIINGKKGPFNDYSTHNFKFYYMERGSGSGVCRMNFNFPVLDQNKIHVMKELTVQNEDISVLGDPDFRFQILKANGETGEVFNNQPLIEEGVEYKIFEGNNEIKPAQGGTWKTGPNGIFTIKAGQRAEFDAVSENSGDYVVQELIDTEFFDKYAQFFIGVDGSSVTTNAKDVVIGNDTFHGIQSNVKRANDGKLTVFQFNNQLKFDKLGNLEISKILEGNTSSISTPFEFEVTLDGKAIPDGRPYTITGNSPISGVNLPGNAVVEVKNGTSTIKLFPGQTAKFSGIVAGTRFTIKEIEAKNYTVSYKVDGQQIGGKEASGIIGTDENSQKTVQVEVKNTEHNIELKIPVKKILKQTDGKAYTYHFKLKPVQLGTNGKFSEIPDAEKQEVLINVKSSDNSGVSTTDNEFFWLNYYVTEEPKTYYYRISEVSEQLQLPTTLFDVTNYILKVDVSGDKSPIQVTAAYKEENEPDEAYKNLDIATGLEPNTDKGISFTNTLLRKLSITKNLKNAQGEFVTDSNRKFTFEIIIHNLNDVLDSNIELLKGNNDSNDIEFAEFVETSSEGKQVRKGKVTVIVDAGKTKDIYLPYNAEYTITETNTDGYYVSYQIGDGESKQGSMTTSETLVEDKVVTFTNKLGVVLPDTGGPGLLMMSRFGWMLLLLALLMAGMEIQFYGERRNRKTANVQREDTRGFDPDDY